VKLRKRHGLYGSLARARGRDIGEEAKKNFFKKNFGFREALFARA
jgi:hypothetical protein